MCLHQQRLHASVIAIGRTSNFQMMCLETESNLVKKGHIFGYLGDRGKQHSNNNKNGQLVNLQLTNRHILITFHYILGK